MESQRVRHNWATFTFFLLFFIEWIPRSKKWVYGWCKFHLLWNIKLFIKVVVPFYIPISSIQLSSVQSLSHVRLFETPWTATFQASLSIINSQSLLKLMSIESVMPSTYLLLCCPLLLPPSNFPIIRVFSNESALHIRWPKYWSFSFNISPL